MHNVVLIVHLILALSLVGVVLLQRSEGGGLGMGGGGGGAISARGVTTALGKLTWGLAVAFLITSITLTVLAAQNASTGSVVDRLGLDSPDLSQPGPAAPAGADLLPPPPVSTGSGPLLPPPASEAAAGARLGAAAAPVYEPNPVTGRAGRDPAPGPTRDEARDEARGAAMARYIFITGGVVSSLGKGLASAALGALLQARGFTVRLRKLDPYLNVDPGTMSPFEHGEVFVTDDGAETDLDLGHYERFTGVAARRTDSISAGRIYSNVLEKERRGDYLGRTIQVIPHVTNEIKEFLRIGEDEVDFMLCEIGGTVGDIEGLPFFEAIRQFAQERPRGQCIFMHLTLLPFIKASGELKTKPTQHSVKELRGIGLAPDILVCRSEGPIPEKERDKLALFCNVRPGSVIEARDLKSIYSAPLAYHEAGLDQAVLDAFGIHPAPRPNLDRWRDVQDRIEHPEGEVRIAVVGKYTQLEDAYKSIGEALTHGGFANRVRVRPEWIGAERLEVEEPAQVLQGFQGILVPGGFGERGTEGKIRAAAFARARAVPYLGICLGMQMAVVEAARGIAELSDAGSEEFDDEALAAGAAGAQPGDRRRFTPVVYHLKEWVQGNHVVERRPGDDKGGTMRLGAYDAVLQEGSKVAEVYGATRIEERHRHRYEVDIKYRDRLEAEGLCFTGMSPDGRLPEIVEARGHPWFIGVQFHPELKSKPFAPHPLFADFIRAAKEADRLV